MTIFSKRLMMPTDVAHILIFHPDDLAHCAGWPIGWYSEPFIFPIESEAGRLVAWCTGCDGGFAVRITNGQLDEREARYAGASWTFPYSVRHGRVYLDNSDALPGIEQMNQTSDYEDYWIEVPNGDYAVTVTGIEWQAEPGARDEGFDTLPNYVVRFSPAGSENVKVAKRPPDIISSMAEKASDEVFTEKYESPDDILPKDSLPAFVSANVKPIGFSFHSQGEAPITAAIFDNDDRFVQFDQYFVIVAAPEDLSIGGLAILAKISGLSSESGHDVNYEFRALNTVRIISFDGMFQNGHLKNLPKRGLFINKKELLPGDALVAVSVAAWDDQQEEKQSLDAEIPHAKREIETSLTDGNFFAKRLGNVANYEALKVRSFNSVSKISHWLINHLPIETKERLHISVLPENARFNALYAIFKRLDQLDRQAKNKEILI